MRTDDQIRALREEFDALVASGQPWSFASFAKQHGEVGPTMIHWLRGLSRREAGGPIFSGHARNHGSPRSHRKLTLDGVRFIRRQWHWRALSLRQLARWFGVGNSIVEGIVYGETYREAGGPTSPRGARKPYVILKRGLAAQKRYNVARAVIEDGFTLREAAAVYGVSWGWAQRVVFAERARREKKVAA